MKIGSSQSVTSAAHNIIAELLNNSQYLSNRELSTYKAPIKGGDFHGGVGSESSP